MPLSLKYKLGLKKLSRTDSNPAPVLVRFDTQPSEHVSSLSLPVDALSTTVDSWHLYVGSAGCIQDVSRFVSLGFTHALCLAQGLDEDPAVSRLIESGIQWKYLGIADKCNEDLTSILEEAIAMIDRVKAAGGKVLVYCFQGKSRSVAVCCAYLMRRAGLRFEEALQRVRLTRPEAEPNIGFSLALLRYGRTL
jgi:hypothetical protein